MRRIKDIDKFKMKYKVLIVEKIGNQDYCTLLSKEITDIIEEQQIYLARYVQEFLESQGHSVNFRRNLEETTDEEYRNSDVALIHLTKKGIPRVCKLRSQYSYVGLIITTGDSGEEFQDLIYDADGTYILPKPYTPESLLRTMEIVKRTKIK
ncbi:MAG: hypothetical protein AABW75_01930 [Nanoarchaeota archaeon]